MKTIVLDTIMGLVVADALGVPVEFQSRASLKAYPVTGMRAYGTHHQPAGTWSDDSSMTLATLDSLLSGLNYHDIMKKFSLWETEAKYTATDEVFDIGIATSQAIDRYLHGTPAEKCGGTGEYDNGNGSLMRIAPIILYLYATGHDLTEHDQEGYDIIHKVSALTHAHPRSQMGCGIYGKLLLDLLAKKGQGINKEQITLLAIDCALYSYDAFYPDHEEIATYEHLVDICTLSNRPEEDIRSSGYVVHSLEAAIYCFLTTDTYKDCVLKAVNLGDDTDTVGAIAGSLAGAFYGYEQIPEEWLKVIAKKEDIAALCDRFTTLYFE